MTQSWTLTTVFAPAPDVVARQVKDKTLLLPMGASEKTADSEFFALDPCGAEIWARLDGQRTVAAVVAELQDAYGAPAEDVTDLLSELAEFGLIVDSQSEAA